jgi:N-methylhydantoinase B
MRALAPVIPERVSAGWNQLLCSLSTGRDPAKNDNYVDILFMGLKGGSGARCDCDGYDHIGMIDASGGILDQDYEMFEQQTPHRLLHHEYKTDSAGAGQFRGGLGVETRYLVGGENTQIVTFGDGDIEPAFGVNGGKDSTLNSIELHYPDGEVHRPTTKDLVEDVPAGTIYIQQAGGGGGYGSPRKRPPETVRREVEDGIISVEAARELYGINVAPETIELRGES